MTRGLILLFVVACSKKDDAPAPTPADKPKDDKPAVVAESDKPATAPAAPPAKLKDAPGSADLAKLPIDSDVVAGIDPGQLQASALWNELIAPRVMSDDIKAKLAKFKQLCDLDPLAAVKTATVGIKVSTKDVFAIVHGPAKAKVAACAEKMKADPELEVAIDGDTTILKPKGGGTPIAFTFTSESDAIVAVGAKADAAGLKSIASSTTGLSGSGPFVDAYNKLPTDKALWVVANGKIDQFKSLALVGLKASLVFGALDVKDGMDLDLRMRLASADQATQSATMLKSQMVAAKDALKLDKAEAAADASDLKLNFVVAKQNLGAMLKGATDMMKMAGMGGPK